jgi:type II secretory pathway pseudopilin PulG
VKPVAATADGPTVLRRLRSEEAGFGLIELVLAMVLLSIAMLALMAAFSSGAVTLRRASRIATATALGERQMELYRGLRYSAIGLATTDGVDSPYTENQPEGTIDLTSCTDATKAECKPIQTVTGADGRTYRIDSYVVTVPFSGTHDYKLVRVIVRDSTALERTLVRQESTFDESTGS